jgi:hypothetical protein
MKNFFLILVLLSFLFIEGVSSEEKMVKIEKIPTTIEEFVSFRDKISKDPEGGCTMMLLALYIYAKDEKLGLQCLTVALDKHSLKKGANGYKGYEPGMNAMNLIKYVKRQPYMINSYFPGTTFSNRYTVPPPPYMLAWRLMQSGTEVERKKYKFMLHCNGADSPRGMTVRANDKGIYKAVEFSSFVLEVKSLTTSDDSDDL